MSLDSQKSLKSLNAFLKAEKAFSKLLKTLVKFFNPIKLFKAVITFMSFLNSSESILKSFKFNNCLIFQNLWSKLDSRDKEIYYFDMEDVDWSEFLKRSMEGIRLYLMKEDPKTIPAARSRFIK